MTKLIMILSLIVNVSLFATESISPQQKIEKIYNDLYSIDYRILSKDDFATYNQALNDLRDMSVMSFCPVNISRSVVVTLSYLVENPWRGCASGITPAVINKKIKTFEEDSLRECYSQGYLSCVVKESARLKGTYEKGYAETKGCYLTYDIVFTATGYIQE